VVKLDDTIEGGSDVRPMMTISGSDWTLAGRPPGGRKKLAGNRMSSPSAVHCVRAHSRAVVPHELVPWHEKRNSLPGSSSEPVESGRGVQ
jgi:hypothetical protein